MCNNNLDWDFNSCRGSPSQFMSELWSILNFSHLSWHQSGHQCVLARPLQFLQLKHLSFNLLPIYVHFKPLQSCINFRNLSSWHIYFDFLQPITIFSNWKSSYWVIWKLFINVHFCATAISFPRILWEQGHNIKTKATAT